MKNPAELILEEAGRVVDEISSTPISGTVRIIAMTQVLCDSDLCAEILSRVSARQNEQMAVTNQVQQLREYGITR